MGNRTIVSLISIVMVLMVVSVGDPGVSGLGIDTDLSASDASFIGEDTDDQSGISVASAGDVNGDGYDDILIGAKYNDDGGSDAGQTYLILGNASGWSMDTDLSNADASFWGEDAGDYSGCSVAGAGDVNGDGYDDILIGARYDDDGGSDAGQTYLILGKASGWSMDTDLSDADASFWGESADDHSGCVAGAGDVNGDGYDDILIGARYNDDGGSGAGQTYLILGKAAGWAMDTDLSNADASFWGEDAGDYAGWSVAGAGDVNGDGYDDILIGACCDEDGGDKAGQTYLILGKASGWSMDTDLSNADASFWGEDAGDYAGFSVAGSGDANGDGYDDMLIGARYNNDGGSVAGQAYLILGKASGWAMDTDLSNVDASFWGEDAEDRAGFSVSGAGDVNGDGYDDILIGAINNDDGGDRAGQTYLILGKASGWSMDTDLSNADASFLGEGADDRSGLSVAGAGDVNGDGYDDILIGAFRNDDGGIDAGQTYLVFFDDGASPRIEMDTTPVNATTGDRFTFNISVSDNSGIYNVSIEYWYGDSQSHHNVSADRSTGNQTDCTWLLNITTPMNSTETLHYIVHVRNIVDRVTSSIQKDVVVTDNDPPTFGEDASPTTADTDLLYTFSIPVEDNVEVADVWVEYWYGDGSRTTGNLTVTIGTVWELQIIVDTTLEDLHYVFGCVDTSGNVNSTLERTVDVIGVNRPPVIKDYYPNPLWILNETEDGFVLFSILAHDPDSDPLTHTWYVDSVEVVPGTGFEYRFEYDYFSAGEYDVDVVVSDGKEEVNRTWHMIIYNVNRPPVLTNATPESPLYIYEEDGTFVNFTIDAMDPDHDPMTFHWSINEENLTSVTCLTYVFPTDHESSGYYEVIIRVNDTMSDTFISWRMMVEDINRPPVIRFVTSPAEVWVNETEGGSVSFGVDARDPDDDPIFFEWYIDGTRIKGKASDTYAFTYGFESEGDYEVMVVVDDSMASDSHTWSLHINNTNRAPYISSVSPKRNPTLNVTAATSFEIVAVDPDVGEALTYQWYLEGIPIEGVTGPVHTLVPAKAGTYTLAVNVSDPWGSNVIKRWQVTVIEPAVGGPGDVNGGNLLWVAILFIVLIAVGVMVLRMRTRA